MSTRSFSSRHTGAAAEKLAELYQSVLPSTNGSGKSHPAPAEPELAEMLFRRAPETFLQRTSVANLAHITKQMAAFYREYIAAKEPFRVACLDMTGSDNGEHVTAFAIAVTDRPFIVDTFSEYFRQFGTVFVYLHPMITESDGRIISLNYIEVSHVPEPEAREAIVASTATLLADLISVTDGFAPMVGKVNSVIEALENSTPTENIAASDIRETIDFLHWLVDGGFVFLGYRQWNAKLDVAVSPDEAVRALPGADIGLFASANPIFRDGLMETERDARLLLQKDSPLSCAKVLLSSPVHRTARMDLILVKLPDGPGEESVHCFLGLLTSKSISQEASSIPLIRRKLARLIELEGLKPNSHDYKELISIVDSIPKSELLQSGLESLRRMIELIVSVQRTGETRVTLHFDALRRHVFIMVAMLRERFAAGVRQRVQQYLESRLNLEPGSAEFRLAVADDPLVRIHFLIPNPTYAELDVNIAELEQEVVALTKTWDDNVQEILQETVGDVRALHLRNTYGPALPPQYKAATSAEEGAFDIQQLDTLADDEDLGLALRTNTAIEDESQHRFVNLKIYRNRTGLTLSAIIPYLENSNLEILDERVTPVRSGDGASATIYEFRIARKDGVPIALERAAEVFLPGLRAILSGRADNDILNALLLNPGMAVEDIAILRVYQRYLWQIKGATVVTSIQRALIHNTRLAELLVEYFHTKFCPDRYQGQFERRQERLAELDELFYQQLKAVQDLAFDRILRSLFDIVRATLRTNYFQAPGLPVGLK
ncbi:MAG: NAD-glutamate dehydrogenase, partial [Bdellovibrionales bacterium]|nr:NAD-glutamate dehydrogenase [Bdellovibrionales bacterium]